MIKEGEMKFLEENNSNFEENLCNILTHTIFHHPTHASVKTCPIPTHLCYAVHAK